MSVPSPPVQGVGAVAPVQGVVPVASVELVVPCSAGDLVVTRSAARRQVHDHFVDDESADYDHWDEEDADPPAPPPRLRGRGWGRELSGVDPSGDRSPPPD